MLIESLGKAGVEWIMHEPFYGYLQSSLKVEKVETFHSYEDLGQGIDFIFSIGGDGTLLDTLSLVRNSSIPVMGINTGRLGFLSSISKDDFLKAIDALINGHYAIDKRSLLRLETDPVIEGFMGVNYALNELTVHKKDTASMVVVHTFLNGEFMNSYFADGLIISTPTGSTGYSLSCGGPIIIPQSENFVITPVAPHNMNVRPVVVSDKNIISIQVEGRSRNFLVSLDARSVTIDYSIRLAVRKEDFGLNLVRLNNENFLTTLRDKLAWGIDSRTA